MCSFAHLALFNALGHDYSPRVPVSTVPGLFSLRGGLCLCAAPELIYYGGRTYPVILTPVIGNNVCRERVGKETGKEGWEKGERVQRGRRGFFSNSEVTHLIRVEYVPRKMSGKLKLHAEFSRLTLHREENARNNCHGIKSQPLLRAHLPCNTITCKIVAKSTSWTTYAWSISQLLADMKKEKQRTVDAN